MRSSGQQSVKRAVRAARGIRGMGQEAKPSGAQARPTIAAQGAGRRAPERRRPGAAGSSTSGTARGLVGISAAGLAGYGVVTNYDAIRETAVGKWIDAAADEVDKAVLRPFMEPSEGAVLPAQHPQYTGALTVLVNVNGTLISKQWSKQHGWRVVKRPGWNKLLSDLAQMAEVVLVSDMEAVEGTELVEQLIPDRTQFQLELHRDSMRRLRNGSLVRGMDVVNRDPASVLVLDVKAETMGEHADTVVEIPKFEFKSAEDLDDVLHDVAELVKYVVTESNGNVPDRLHDIRVDAVRALREEAEAAAEAGGEAAAAVPSDPDALDTLTAFRVLLRRERARKAEQLGQSMVNRVRPSRVLQTRKAKAGSLSAEQQGEVERLQRAQQAASAATGAGGVGAMGTSTVEAEAELAKEVAEVEQLVAMMGAIPAEAVRKYNQEMQQGLMGPNPMVRPPQPPQKLPSVSGTRSGKRSRAYTMWQRFKDHSEAMEMEQMAIMRAFHQEQMKMMEQMQHERIKSEASAQELEYQRQKEEAANARRALEAQAAAGAGAAM